MNRSAVLNVALRQGLKMLPLSNDPFSHSGHAQDIRSNTWILATRLAWQILCGDLTNMSSTDGILMVKAGIPDTLFRLAISNSSVAASVRNAASRLLQIFMNEQMQKRLQRAFENMANNEDGDDSAIAATQHDDCGYTTTTPKHPLPL